MTKNESETRPVDIRRLDRPPPELRLQKVSVPLAPKELGDGSYFEGPLLPRLLQAAQLAPGGIVDYGSTFGRWGLRLWILDELPELDWSTPSLLNSGSHLSGLEAMENRISDQFQDHLRNSSLIDRWLLEAAEMRRLLELAASDLSVEDAFREATTVDPPFRPKFSYEVVEIDGSPTFAAEPRSDWDRAWIELLDMLNTGNRPVRCGWCGQWFPPSRRGQRHCLGTDCGDRAARRRWDRTPYRKEYLKMHKRMQRGSITDEQFEDWKRAHGSRSGKGGS